MDQFVGQDSLQLSQRGFRKQNMQYLRPYRPSASPRYNIHQQLLPRHSTTTPSTLAIQTMLHSENIHIQCARSFPMTCLSNLHTVIFTAATSCCSPLDRLPALSQSSTTISLADCRSIGSSVRPCGLRGQVMNGSRSISRWSWKGTTCTTSGTTLCPFLACTVG